MHVYELGREVEVALKVAGVYDIDDHVGSFLHELLAHVKFLGGVGGKGISAGKVNDVERVAFVLGVSSLRVHGHARVVANALV